MPKTRTREEYIELLAIKNPNAILIGDYTNAKTKTDFLCLLHNETWNTTPDVVLKGHGCQKCHSERTRIAKVKSQEQYLLEKSISNPSIELVGQYINTITPTLHHCLIHDTYWNVRPSDILRGKGCRKCQGDKISKSSTKTEQQYREDLFQHNPFIILAGSYINNREKTLHKCTKHNVEWYTTPNAVLAGKGCPECLREKISIKKKKSKEQYIDELSKVNPLVEIVGDYLGAQTETLHFCKIHEKTYYTKPTYALKGCGCPLCNESKGEKRVRTVLDSMGITYERGKKFKGLTGVGRIQLSYDFYIPFYHVLIEFQGIQHEKPIDFFGGEKSFNIQKEHDRRKKTYAITHGFNLLEISYHDMDKIEKIICDYITSLNSGTVTTTGVAQ